MPAPGSTSGAYKLGEAFVELKAKDAGFIKKIVGASIGLSSLTAMLTTAATAAINFEKQMAKVSVMLVDGATKFLPAYSKGVQELAVRFGDSTKSLTQGLYDILSATQPAAVAMHTLEISAEAAIAGMTSTAVAAKTISGFMNAYNINVTKAGDVSDWMFEIIRRGQIEFPGLAAQLGQAASSASLVGLSMDELGAAISTVTRAGIPAGRAMTAINALMQAFLKPTELAEAIAKKYGFGMSTVTLKTMGLIGVLKELSRANVKEIGATAGRIRGIRALASLVKDITGFEADLGFQAKRTGRRQEALAKMSATTAFKLGQLKQEVVRLAVDFGSLLLPKIKAVVKWFSSLLRSIHELSPAVKKMVVNFALLTPVVLTGWLLLPKIIDRIARPLRWLAGVLLLPLRGITLLSKGIGFLLSQFGLLIGKTIKVAVTLTTSLAQAAMGIATTTMKGLGYALLAVTGTLDVFAKALAVPLGLIGSLIGGVGKLVSALGPLIERLTVPLAKMTIGPALMGIIGIAGFSIWDKFRKSGEKGIGGIANAFKRFADWFKTTYGDNFSRIIINLKRAFRSLAFTIGNAISKLLNKWTGFTDATDKSKDSFTKITDSIVAGLEKASNWILTVARNLGLVWEIVTNKAEIAFIKLGDIVRDVAQKIADTFRVVGTEIAEMLLDVVKSPARWLKQNVMYLGHRKARRKADELLDAAKTPEEKRAALKYLRELDKTFESHFPRRRTLGGQVNEIWGRPKERTDTSALEAHGKTLEAKFKKEAEKEAKRTDQGLKAQKTAEAFKKLGENFVKGMSAYWKKSPMAKLWANLRAEYYAKPRPELGTGGLDKAIGGGMGGVSAGQRSDIWFGLGGGRMGGQKPQDKVAVNVKAAGDQAHNDVQLIVKAVQKLGGILNSMYKALNKPGYNPNRADAIHGTFA